MNYKTVKYLYQYTNSVFSVCVSVSQRNNSDCIYICVMAGKMGKSDLFYSVLYALEYILNSDQFILQK